MFFRIKGKPKLDLDDVETGKDALHWSTNWEILTQLDRFRIVAKLKFVHYSYSANVFKRVWWLSEGAPYVTQHLIENANTTANVDAETQP